MTAPQGQDEYVRTTFEVEEWYCAGDISDEDRQQLRAEFRAWLAEHDAEVASRAVEGAVARLRRLAEDEVAPLRPGQWRLVADLVQESDRIERQEATR